MHSSIDKGAIVAGVGRAGIRRIPVDEAYRMRADLLADAIAEDRRQGWTPFCAVATLGTTSSTSIDPAGAIADVCAREKIWLHVDAAYGGAAALLPEMRPLFSHQVSKMQLAINVANVVFNCFCGNIQRFGNPLNTVGGGKTLCDFLFARGQVSQILNSCFHVRPFFLGKLCF